MASLALMVSIIFLNVLLLGPLALLISKLGFKIIGVLVGVVAIFVGSYWLCCAPFPISTLGIIGLICGGFAVNKI